MLYQDRPSPALYHQEEGSSGPSLIAGLEGGMMSRLAGFYIATVMESAAAGTTAGGASRRSARRAADHAAPAAIRSHGRGRSASHRVATAVRHLIGGLDTAGRDRRTTRA